MVQFQRAAGRWEVLRLAASALGLAILLMVAAFGFAAIESGPSAVAVVAALAAVAIGGSGLLYAWRLGAGGVVD
jgi:hypothetical protein